MGKDIETLLWRTKFSSKKEINKYLRDEDYFDSCISYICSRLKRNCLNYPKIIRNFQKNCLETKKKFPHNQKKSFLDLMKKVTCLIKKNFSCYLAP